MTTFFRTCVLMSIVVSPIALAQDVEPAASSDVSVAPTAGGLDIHDVIASVSSRTRKRFLIDPACAQALPWLVWMLVTSRIHF